MSVERTARWSLGLIAVGVPLAVLGLWRVEQNAALSVHARVSAHGGWQPAALAARVGEPLRLRLLSDDVEHSFALGRSDMTPIQMPAGKAVLVSLVFTNPGRYTFYCTRWCGADHWRMRGVIEVTGEGAPLPDSKPAPYLAMGIDLEADHPAGAVPAARPSAARGAALEFSMPNELATRQAFIAMPPSDLYQRLRRAAETSGLSNGQVWDLVAFQWKATSSPAALEQGRLLYAQNCAACHGEDGSGEGVFAEEVEARQAAAHAAHPVAPVDFTEARRMLGASSALLHGKIVRGGMGTGMPAWGQILTDDQAWALVDYLWTFQFKEAE